MDTTVKHEEVVEVTGGVVVALSDAGKPLGEGLRIGPHPCIVGRGQHCHLVVADPLMSTSHCELVATDHGLLVRDLGSTNGTFVNQARIQGGVWLTTDARLRCGQSWFAVRVAGPEPVPLLASGSFGPLVGRSAAMRRLYTQLAKIAPHDLSVLITGETGTGKELVARAIHESSPRRRQRLVIIDCTTIPAALAESRLFGHEKGAFTGAVSRQTSPLLEAQGGTVFFDELGELPPEVQPKLLRALESRQIQSVGSTRYQPIDVRVVAATRRDMHAEVNAKRFRDDLFYRFAQTTVEVPPLRARPEDVPDLVARFLSELGDPGAVTRIDKPSRDRLMRYDWPGNVRELRNVVRVAHAQAAGGGPLDFVELLSARGVRAALSDRATTARSFHDQKRELLERFETEFFTALLRETGGNLSEMARRSGLARSSIREALERLKLAGGWPPAPGGEPPYDGSNGYRS